MNQRALPTGATASLPAQPQWELRQIVDELRTVRERWREGLLRHQECGAREFPSRQHLRDIVAALCAALFPMRLGPLDLQQESEDFFVGHTLDTTLTNLHEQVRRELSYHARQHGLQQTVPIEQQALAIVQRFARALPRIRAQLDTDVQAAFHGDPAAHSVDEVLLCYPGILAIIHYRLAHSLHVLGAPLVARIIAEVAHSQTGIDIHPGAVIGSSFFIDHGTGVVIGETAIIGERVRIYQAVTLGAKRFPAGSDGVLKKGLARHPIVQDDVVIYAGATILGRVTIGQGSVIGGNVWLTRNVAPHSHVTQAQNHQEVPRETDAVAASYTHQP
ncbi:MULTISPECIES: serine O-acetyltransferase EpsC [unclassified Janthinobacterium]|uniref:serine O-acetyltransferase EpsC n=1 Tax=unclassified Janthinobacterium TaxID=2610881 RepID=UPI0016107BD7|nr:MULTISPECIES: serine O-acetyltransferase EpsC [unclassified Janthinobacterium]MBB5370729.1 serine O-acetyltransferase [Janthinobacterium sp. K2C7]MBB5383535.1 serine O-acetyltransferase [Janthinobacterium sp. K2Li3]MBB5388989.1 serine O-acetyltransferase [Janthinobacterium sp. K2E3]